ncbi:MAG: stage III sporulation protein AF [Bacillota bacterium]
MLETLGGLVTSIAVIVIFAVFVEMFLPNNSMGSYLRLVVGLFIIATILTPIINALDKDNSFEIVTWSYSLDHSQTQSILKKGDEINEINSQRAVKEYKSRMEGQIIALVKLIPDIESAEATVILNDFDKSKHGLINNIIIGVKAKINTVERENSFIQRVEQVIIDSSMDNRNEKQILQEQQELLITELELKIRNLLKNFFGLYDNQIQIIWK